MIKFQPLIIILAISLSAWTQAATYGGGSGTVQDPYQIWTPEQMNTIGLNPADWDKSFKLMADIDMSAYTGTQYNRIGTSSSQAFRGRFDGNGHSISNLTYSTTAAQNNVGMFGYAYNAELINLGLVNVSISSAGDTLGALVGIQLGGIITNCFSTGSITGLGNYCFYLGGLVGNNDSIMNGCFSSVSVTGGAYSGYLGGLVGEHSLFGAISNSYSTGPVTAGKNSNSIGGLVGRSEGIIQDCYSTGLIAAGTSSYFLGGLVGVGIGGVINSFFNTQTCGLSYSGGGKGQQLFR